MEPRLTQEKIEFIATVDRGEQYAPPSPMLPSMRYFSTC
jgi:hypothetical protein